MWAIVPRAAGVCNVGSCPDGDPRTELAVLYARLNAVVEAAPDAVRRRDAAQARARITARLMDTGWNATDLSAAAGHTVATIRRWRRTARRHGLDGHDSTTLTTAPVGTVITIIGITADEAALRLGVSRDALSELLLSGALRPLRTIAGHHVFDPVDVAIAGTDGKGVLTRHDVQRLLGRSREAVRQYLASERLRRTKLSAAGAHRITPARFHDFLRAHPGAARGRRLKYRT